jgi:DNA-binding transcriptional LysR family regulator
MNLNDTAAFVLVASHGSFSRAAQLLGVPKGTVSRRIARLEDHLGTRLLQRTTRQVGMTDAGRAYYERCRHAVEAIEDAERLVHDVKGTVTGTLRISVAADLMRTLLAPSLGELRARHPQLRLEIDVSQRKVDLVAENIDVALRGGASIDDSNLVVRKLAESSLLLCATPAYLEKRGTPLTVANLDGHECISFLPAAWSWRWKLMGDDGPVDIDLRGWIAVNEIGAVHELTRAGHGIGLCESNMVREDLARDRLRRVLPDLSVPGGGLWAVYPSKHHLSPKVRAFVDFIDEHLASWRARPRARARASPRKARKRS